MCYPLPVTGQPDLNLLPLFVAVADTKNMSAAARRHRVPKSTISRGISALEESLGVQLFHRTTRSVELTGAGRAFYERAKPLLASLGKLAQNLPDNEDEPSGDLRISAPVDIAVTWLSAAAAEFSARYPGLYLDVRPTNRYVDILAESYDLAVRVDRRLADSSLVVRRLTGLEMGIYASPLYLARRGHPRTLEETSTHDWVLFTNQSIPISADQMKRPRLVTDDLIFACESVKQGMGIGILPCFLAQQDVIKGGLVRVAARWVHVPFSLFFVHPYTKHVPRKVAVFRDFIVDRLVAHPLSFTK